MTEKHLCIAIDRHTKEQIGQDMIIEAEDWYYARHKAAKQFREVNPNEERDWCIDSMHLSD